MKTSGLHQLQPQRSETMRFNFPAGSSNSLRRWVAGFSLGLLQLATSLPAAAQRAPVAGIRSSTAAAGQKQLRPYSSIQTVTAEGRGSRAARYGLIGALTGAATGVLTAFILTHQERVKDHSEDALAYMFLVPTGALAGGVIGAIVGAVRK
jgi:hypothetical protein